MKQGVRRGRRIGGLLAIVGVAVAAAHIPGATWVAWGERLALTAVSLQQREQTVQTVGGSGTRPVAGASLPSTETLEPLPESGAEQQPFSEEAAATVTLPQAEIPPEDGTGGKVVEQTLGGGTLMSGIHVKNKSGVAVDMEKALTATLPFAGRTDTADPLVLIYHTHTTESYMPYDAGYYNAGDTPRVTGNPHTVVAVGEALAAKLRAAGIGVIHDTTVYDSPNYRGAYERSVVMMEEMLQRYPGICLTLDLHRDGLAANETDKLKPVTVIDGEKTAQMMIVCGVLSTESLPHPNWRQNLSVAAQLQQRLETAWPGLMRPLSLTSARYNQYMTPASLLVEMGSDGNTVQEACRAAERLGEQLIALLT